MEIPGSTADGVILRQLHRMNERFNREKATSPQTELCLVNFAREEFPVIMNVGIIFLYIHQA
jgi:hypothetical protein